MKWDEEYCWAITQAAGRSCIYRSSSSVLELGIHMKLTKCVLSCDWRKIILSLDAAECNRCVIRGVSVLLCFSTSHGDAKFFPCFYDRFYADEALCMLEYRCTFSRSGDSGFGCRPRQYIRTSSWISVFSRWLLE